MIYTASLLLTQNASRTLLHDAALAVSGTEIADVGPRATPANPSGTSATPFCSPASSTATPMSP